MKMKILFSIFAGLFLLNTICMCSSDDNNDSASNVVKNQVITTVSAGTWRVTLFEENGVIETTNYSGYSFAFGSGNVLTATNGTNTYTGNWSISDTNSNDDTLDDLHFNISFSTPKDFADLSDDWDIVERTDTRIKLKDVSGGDGGTDFLTFEKN